MEVYLDRRSPTFRMSQHSVEIQLNNYSKEGKKMNLVYVPEKRATLQRMMGLLVLDSLEQGDTIAIGLLQPTHLD